MKHKRLIGIVSLLICGLLSVSLAACSKEEVTIESISLNTQQVQTSFAVGDEFTYEGLVVTAHYSDESTETVTEYTVTTPDMNTTGVKSVTVTYEEKTAKYDITVFADRTHTLNSITLDTTNVKKTFVVGDEFTYEGLVVTAHYNDGDDEVLDEEDYEVDGYDMSTEGTQTVTVTYEGKAAYYQITVNPVEHNYGEPVWKWAGNKEDGYTAKATFTCTDCDDEQVETATVTSSTTDATCEDDGETVYTATVTFKDTDYKDTKRVTIPATGHNYGEPVWTWAENDEDGYTAKATFTCTNCDDEQVITATVTSKEVQTDCTYDKQYTAEVDFNNDKYTDKKTITLSGQHTFTDGWIPEAPATCEDDGVKAHYHCTVCEKNFKDDEATEIEDLTIPATGHDYELTGWIWTGSDEDGYTKATAKFTCSNCDDEQSVEDTDLTVETTPETPTKDGKTIYTATVTFEGKDYSDEKEVIIPAAGHNLNEITLDIEKVQKYFETGENFNYNKLKVTAHYDNGDKVLEVEEYSVDEPDTAEAGTKVVTVRYTDDGTTKTATYNIIVMADYSGGEVKYTAKLADVDGCKIEEHTDGTDGHIIGAISGSESSSFTYTINSSVENTVEIILAAAGKLEPYGAVEGALQLFVNGSETAVANITVGTGNYTNFTQIFVCYAELQEGINILEFRAENANGNVNVDYLLIAEKLLYTGIEHKYGSEMAVFGREDDNNLQSNAAGWDGKFYGGIETNDTITYTIKSTVAGYVNLSVSIAGGKNDNYNWTAWTDTSEQAFKVLVNGEEYEFGPFDVGPDGYLSFHEMLVGRIYLKEGINTIDIVAVNAGYNFNYLLISAPVNVLTDITVNTDEVQMVFFEGDEFNYENLTVTAHYSIDEDKQLDEVEDGYTVECEGLTEGQKLSEGTYTVRITYTEGEVTVTKTYEITVNPVELDRIELNISSQEFSVGETFNYDNLEVTAYYNNNTHEKLNEKVDDEDGYILTGLTKGQELSEGEYTIEVSYTKGDITMTATYTVNVTTRYITQITVIDPNPDLQKEFYQYDEFNYDGLKIKVDYNNGTSNEIESNDIDLKVSVDMTKSGNVEVKVEYRGVETQYAITIIALDKIEVDASGAKTKFIKDDLFDSNGIVVSAVYVGGHRIEFKNSDFYTVGTPNMATPGTDIEVTVTFTPENVFTEADFSGVQTKTATYTITVRGELQSITVDATDAQTEFAVGDVFKYEGIVVTAHYDDEFGDEEIDLKDLDVTGYNMTKAGVYTITVTYNEKTAEYEIIVMVVFNNAELIIEAEDADLLNCVAEQNEYVPASGGKFVGGIGHNEENQASLTFKFISKVNGIVEIDLGAAGTTESGAGYIDAFRITVNGDQAGYLNVRTRGWTNFTPLFVGYMKVEEGASYTVVFTAVNTNGQVNVDYFKVTPVELDLTSFNGEELTFGAKSARLEGSLINLQDIWSDRESFDGQFVGNVGEGDKITYYFDSTVTGAVNLKIFADCYQDYNSTFKILVNGKQVGGILSIDRTDVLIWGEASTSAALKEGLNTVQIVAISGGCNFKGLVITPVKYTGSNLTLGASSAVVEGSGNHESGFNETFDGSLIGGIQGDTVIKLNFYSNEATSVKLFVSVDGASESQISFDVYLNGEKVGTCSTTADGWLNFNEITVDNIATDNTATLINGMNTIEIRSDEGGFNFNYLRFEPATTSPAND